MTSTVKVSAHCGDDKHVEVSIASDEGVSLAVVKNQDSEDFTFYDEVCISVREVDVPNADPPAADGADPAETVEPAQD